MSEYDLHSSIDDRVALMDRAYSLNTTFLGEIIDTIGFELVEFVVMSGPVLATLNIFLEQGDNGSLSDATPLSSGERLGDLPQFNPGDDNMIKRVGSIGKRRFQRLSLVVTNSTGTSNLPSYAILGRPHTLPVPQ